MVAQQTYLEKMFGTSRATSKLEVTRHRLIQGSDVLKTDPILNGYAEAVSIYSDATHLGGL
jgi:hypothetical protein